MTLCLSLVFYLILFNFILFYYFAHLFLFTVRREELLYGRYRPTGKIIGEGTFSKILEAIDIHHPVQVKKEKKEEEEQEKTETQECERVAIKVMKAVPGQDSMSLMHTKIGQQVHNTYKTQHLYTNTTQRTQHLQH